MFFEKFTTDIGAKAQILPFPDHPLEWHNH
jgi:hypothetical protein